MDLDRIVWNGIGLTPDQQISVDGFLVQKLKKNGYEVHVATEFTNYKNLLNKKGFITHEIDFKRNSLNIFLALIPIFQIFFLYLFYFI